MTKELEVGFLSHFDALEDPRIERKKLYPLSEILLIVICASICGGQSWRDFVTFGEEKLDYLRGFSSSSNGIPSKNTFARVMAMLDPAVFKECFITWIQSIQSVFKEVDWIQFDVGKSLS